MANNLGRFLLSSLLGGGVVKDYQHAAQTFRPNSNANAGKSKYLFSVFFNINPNVALDVDPRDLTFLVKKIDLPKYTMDVRVMNQYNRKQQIQHKINYSPINITFHDDNANSIRDLWYNYYTYYYADGRYQDTTYYRNDKYSSQRTESEWGLNSGSTVPFFTSIDIYSLWAGSSFRCSLENPIIQSFNHDGHNYSDGGDLMEASMTVGYTSVVYDSGYYTGTPGIGDASGYDNIPSSLAGNLAGSIIDPSSGNVINAGNIPSTFQNNYTNAANTDLGLLQQATNLVAGQGYQPTILDSIATGALSGAASGLLGGNNLQTSILNGILGGVAKNVLNSIGGSVFPNARNNNNNNNTTNNYGTNADSNGTLPTNGGNSIATARQREIQSSNSQDLVNRANDTNSNTLANPDRSSSAGTAQSEGQNLDNPMSSVASARQQESAYANSINTSLAQYPAGSWQNMALERGYSPDQIAAAEKSVQSIAAVSGANNDAERLSVAEKYMDNPQVAQNIIGSSNLTNEPLNSNASIDTSKTDAAYNSSGWQTDLANLGYTSDVIEQTNNNLGNITLNPAVDSNSAAEEFVNAPSVDDSIWV
jgi:hypothetical protein